MAKEQAALADLPRQAYPRLLEAVTQLASVQDLEQVTTIVKHAALELSGADGTTFVLRDGDLCYYVDEEAITPLWKGQRFPMQACISGWVMLNRKPALIPDIYQDARIPLDAYRPTFVKSLAMVPIRTQNPLGAIGTYWSSRHSPVPTTLAALQLLADASATAFANLQLYKELERAALDLEDLLFAASHNLREPLINLEQFVTRADAALRAGDQAAARTAFEPVLRASTRMRALLQDLVILTSCRRAALHPQPLVGCSLAQAVLEALGARVAETGARISLAEQLPTLYLDRDWAARALGALLDNALKFTQPGHVPEIEIDAVNDASGPGLVIRDRGPGIPPQMGDRIFALFQRGVGRDIPGTGAGLTLARQVAEAHGGRLWHEAREGGGAQFFITFGREQATGTEDQQA